MTVGASAPMRAWTRGPKKAPHPPFGHLLPACAGRRSEQAHRLEAPAVALAGRGEEWRPVPEGER